MTRFIVCKESQQAQRDLQSIPATLVMENSTEVEQSRSPWKGQDPRRQATWENWALTSFPSLATPQTVCSLTKLALMLKYLTFLQNENKIVKYFLCKLSIT